MSYHQKYYEENRDKIIAQKRIYNEKNRERINQRQKEYRKRKGNEISKKEQIWRSQNKDKIKEKNQLYYQRNKERLLAENKEYRNENRDKLNADKRNWNRNNKDKRISYNQNWVDRNPQKVLARQLKHLKRLSQPFNQTTFEYKSTLRSWGDVIKKRDGSCVICGSKSKLNAHHIIHRAVNPKLAFVLNNGVTLCKQHHDEVHGNNLIRA